MSGVLAKESTKTGCMPCFCTSFLNVSWKPAAAPAEAHRTPQCDGDCSVSMSSELAANAGPEFGGKWICKATWGLESFLVAMGVGHFQRRLALIAAWPTWEFVQDGSSFVYVNRGMLGDVREDFCANGAEYTTLNGWKQEVVCRAFWEDATLVIVRSSSEGPFREERFIDSDGLLQFTLHGLAPPVHNQAWGRTFERVQGDGFTVTGALEGHPDTPEMQAQKKAFADVLFELGVNACEVDQVVAETSSLEEAASLLLDRIEASTPKPSFWETITGTGLARTACLPGKYKALKRLKVCSGVDMVDVLNHIEKGKVVDIVAVKVVDDGYVLGKLPNQCWIKILVPGVALARRIPLELQLMELGFSETEAQEAAKRHSSFEAAVEYLAAEVASDRTITCEKPIAKQAAVVPQLLTLGFSQAQAEEAAKRHSSLEAAVDYLAVEAGSGKVVTVGETIAKHNTVASQLMDLGFSEASAQKAAKRCSSLEAAVAFLSDNPTDCLL